MGKISKAEKRERREFHSFLFGGKTMVKKNIIGKPPSIKRNIIGGSSSYSIPKRKFIR